MPTDDTPIAPDATEPDRIDLNSDAARTEWATKLGVTQEQLKEAIRAVGDRATDVELHLKGSRSTTNTERVHDAGGGA